MPDDDVVDQPEPPLEGTLTAEDIEEIRRDGITLADVIRELEVLLPPDEPIIREG